jgi:serine/threonine protein kinase
LEKEHLNMKNPQNPDPSASQASLSAYHLQNSSLLTQLPAEQRPAEVKQPEQPPTSAPQQESAPASGSGGQVTLDFTIRFTDLTFGDLLGQGGYGKVFAGEWKFNQVAIKQYTAQDFSEQTRQEIRKEAMVMATVSTQSDYLVRLRGMILEKPQYSLVMEYLPGGDLFHLLKSSETLTWPRRYQIGLDMTIGLHHLHERSVLHRDLKSLNVLLDGSGRAKLADFGLSTLKTSSASTTAGGFKGTVLWSAPELFKRGAKATVFSDIYSLGMVLWELASRKIPFADAATPAIAATWVAQGEQEIVPEETPQELKQLIESCWDKEPSKRPNANVVAKRLEGMLREGKQPDEKSSPTGIHSPGSSESAHAGGSHD